MNYCTRLFLKYPLLYNGCNKFQVNSDIEEIVDYLSANIDAYLRLKPIIASRFAVERVSDRYGAFVYKVIGGDDRIYDMIIQSELMVESLRRK